MQLKSPTDTPIHVALLDGNAIRIGPEGREVPIPFRKRAFAEGCIPMDVKAEDMSAPMAEPTEHSRAELLKSALRLLKAEGTPLTGAGLPNRNTVSKTVGWPVTAIELTDAWNSL
ncbi:MAG: hypothetical protein Q8P61_00165 [Candidatus Nanopelagicales bacterium]|nr:hypothetical protein [Candidatus Nanopelagicales bacterium]